MLGIRWFKYRHFMQDNVRKYLAYAGGEIALIIVGILIALQIDAWYENRRVSGELNAQLEAVAASISNDIASLSRLKRQRIETIFRVDRLANITGAQELADEWYTPQYVEFASNLVADSQVPHSFIAGTGAYRVLESSGNANAIRDKQLRANLSDYYATVERIAFAEQEMNSLVRDATLRFQTETTQGLFPFYLREPLLAWQPADLEAFPAEALAFQTAYRELLADSVTQALLRSARNQPLLKEYEHLLSLGKALLAQIHAYRTSSPFPPGQETLFRAASESGPRRVFVQGRFEAHSLGFFTAPVGAGLDAGPEVLHLDADHLTVRYAGGNPWAFVYVAAGPLDVSVRKPFLDYSRYSRIRLELKRESGCDDLRLVLKDARDADDGSQANVRIELSDQWATYDYELSRFSDADLAELNVVTGFLMNEAPCHLLIRDVDFL